MQSALLSAALFFPLVAAHGWLDAVAIDGTVFKGAVPNSGANDSPIRLVNTVEPVKGAGSRDMNCGRSAEIAPGVADANPGSSMTFTWVNGDGGVWVHNTGPMLTYLASCGDVSCNQFDAINAQWFKVDEALQKEDGTWFQADIAAGQDYTMTLPNNLAAGNYLVRHELIGLQIAETEGGAEFYPSCTQIRVGGDHTGAPNGQDLVSLPGAYSDTDPGILVNAFDRSLKYQSPGPAVATLVDNGASASNSSSTEPASGSNSNSEANPSQTSVDESPAAVVTATATVTVTQTVNLQARATDTSDLSLRPYRISRIMRNIVDTHA